MIPSLNGLRALSISLVLIVHISINVGHESWWLHTYAHMGVLIFFVISGYLITTLMLRESGTINIRQFYIRRAWRIFPVAYVYLTVVTMLHHNKFSWSDIILSWTYLSSYAVSFQKSFPWDLDHLWSLSVEEQFYLLWPLAFILNIRWITWIAVIVAPICRYFFNRNGLQEAALYSFPAVVDSIAVGCLIALHAKPLEKFVNSHQRWLGITWILAFSTPAFMVIANNTKLLWPLPQIFGHFAWSIFNISAGVGILWAIAAQPKSLNHWLVNWFGTISYSLYIWHMPFMNPAVNISFPLNVILAILTATASYYLLEQPMLRLRRWASNKK